MNALTTSKKPETMQQVRLEFAARVKKLQSQEGLISLCGYMNEGPSTGDSVLSRFDLNLDDMDAVLSEKSTPALVTQEQQAALTQADSLTIILNNALRLREEGKIVPYQDAFRDEKNLTSFKTIDLEL